MAWHCWLTFLTLLMLGDVRCVPKTQFYPYGTDKGDLVLMPNDEGSSEELEFSKPFVFFQVNHKKAYVNVNGLITFDSDISYFQNQELTEFPHSLIAAFYADVDTHDKDNPDNVHGHIYYRITNDSNVIKRSTQIVRNKFSDAKIFEAKSCLVATWDKVGYFDSKHDKANSFQIVLIQGAHQTYVEILYADNEIQWIKSDGKDIHLPDAPAQAGFLSNDGRSFTLLMSGREEMAEIYKCNKNALNFTAKFNLQRFFRPKEFDAQTNIHMPGVFLYRVSGESVVGPEQIPSTSSVSQSAALDETDDAEDEDETDYYDNVDPDYNQYDLHDKTPTEPNRPKVSEADRKMDAPDISDTADNQNNAVPSTVAAATEAPAAEPTEPAAVAEPDAVPEPEPAQPDIGLVTVAPTTVHPDDDGDAYDDYPTEPDVLAPPSEAPPLPPCPDDPYHGVCPPDCHRENVPPGCVKCVCPTETGDEVAAVPTELPPAPEPPAPEPDQPRPPAPEPDRPRPPAEIPVESHPEPDSGSMPVQSCNEAGVKCHANANCVDQAVGHCCQCQQGYYGNGVECLTDAEPQRINGRFSGKINGIVIPETDLHTYVVTSDGRAYTALSQINPQIGRPLLLLSTIGGVMGWLFAKPSSNMAYNGFMLSGGLFNRTVIVHIGDRHTVTIQQDFSGKDIFHYFKAKVFVTGTLPQIPDDATVEFGEYSEEYNRVGPGIVKSYSSKTITVGSDSQGPQQFQITIDQTIRFNECSFKKFDKEPLTILRIERSYVVYDTAEQIVRYASGNSVESPGEAREDPCREGLHDCVGQHMTCAQDTTKYRCLCLDGYELIFTNELDTRGLCVDLNECARNLHRCDQNAQCHNTEGAYTCICKPGYRGTGFKCISMNQCGPFVCDDDAECMPVPGPENATECVCKPGYFGDGIRCSSFDAPPDFDSGTSLTTTESHFPVPPPFQPRPTPKGDQTCADLSCDRNADCITNQEGILACLCKPGFEGDGYTCNEEARHPIGPVCSSHEECHRSAACIYNTALGHYQCQCRPPYSGDGRHCFLEAETCDRAHNCDRNADCVYRQTELGAGYVCRCRSGFTGDGYSCAPLRTSAPVQCNVLNTCSPNAQCLLIDHNYMCRCNSGYKGDGYKCEQEAVAAERRCRSQDDCHPSGHCVNREGREEYICECLPGFKGNGVTTCEPADQCNPGEGSGACGPNSRCGYDDVEQAYICKCEEGFIGGGRDCRPYVPTERPDHPYVPTERPDRPEHPDRPDRPRPDYPDRTEQQQTCRENPNVCHARARCNPDYNTRTYKCECNPGYRGDGHSYCEPERATCDTQNICDYNARCIQDRSGQSSCVCNTGFEGDGLYCRPAPDCLSTPNICDSNAMCVPENQRYTCRCKPGFHGSGQKCVSDAESRGKTLVFAQGMSLVQRGILQDDRGRQLVVVPHQIAVGVDYDCRDGKVFWTDVSGHAIRSANVDGSNVTMLFDTDLDSPEGIAVDWASRNVYYTDSQLDTIGVATLNGKYSYSLVKEGLVNPRALAVDLQDKKLYYSDWHRERPLIGRLNLDGTNKESFVSDDIALPNGLVILHRRRELCWGDAGKQRLECIGLNGAGRRVVFAPLGYPFGLTVQNEDTFFWTDWEDKKIHSVSIYGGSHATYVPSIGGSGKLYGVVALTDECPPGDSPCGNNNGGCKHICLPDARGGRICVCPENLLDSECNVLNGNTV